MIVTKPLLTHPFYRAWEMGQITTDQLAKYGMSYIELVERMPTWWERALIGMGMAQATMGVEIVADETAHIALWKNWVAAMPTCEGFPRLAAFIDGMDGLNGSELLGAIHAFEVQMPEVSKTKKVGLMKYYGFDQKSQLLTYFDEHATGEDEHTAYAQHLYDTVADKAAFERGFAKGTELAYHALDAFVV